MSCTVTVRSPKTELKVEKRKSAGEFIQLVIENYTTERRAQFYAEKLGISLQHLSTTIKLVTGKNVTGSNCPRCHHRHKSQIEIHRHDHSGNRLLAELPQRLVLRQVLQETHGNEPAGIQEQLTYPLISVTQESTMAIAASMGVNSIPYTG